MALGRKTGGRKKGTPNKRTQEAAALAEMLKGGATTPLEVMLACMRVTFAAGNARLAVEFASKAAPYVHPRLASLEIDLKDVSDEDLRNAAG